MELEYRKCGDYFIPNLVISNTKSFKLGRYGKMRLNYLKTQKKAEYSILLMEDKLSEHLQEIDKTALIPTLVPAPKEIIRLKIGKARETAVKASFPACVLLELNIDAIAVSAFIETPASGILDTKILSTILYTACTSILNIIGSDIVMRSLLTGITPILFSFAIFSDIRGII